MAAALELDAVSKRFGPVVAVEELSLRLEEGAFVGLLGRNGAGKSTTINLATGLLRPSSGTVTVLGLDLARHAVEVKRQIGVMPQDNGQLDCLTGPQLLDLVGRLYGVPGPTVASRQRELFETLDLHP